MAPESALFPILQLLDKAERVFVRKQLGGEELKLFEFAAAQKKFNPAEIRSRFPQLSEAAYANLRSRLQDSIAQAVGEYRHSKMPEARVQLLLGAADTFMNYGQPADAQRMLHKAIKASLDSEVYAYLPHLEGIRKRMPAFMAGDKRAEQKWPIIDDALARLRRLQAESQAVQDLLQAALELKQGGLSGLAHKANHLLGQLPTFHREALSKTNLLLARAHWLCHNFLQQYDACIPYLEWAIALAKQTPRLWQDHEAFECIEAAYFMRSTLWSATFDFEASLSLVQQFRQDSIAARRGGTQDLADRIRLIQMRKLLHSGTKQEIQKGMEAMLNEIGKPRVVSDHLHSLCLRAIGYFIRTKDFAPAKPWLSLLNTAKSDSRRVVKVIGSFLLELTYWYTSGDFDELDNCLRRLAYFAKFQNTELRVVAVVTKGFKSLLTSSQKRIASINAFIDELENSQNKDELNNYLEVFDLKTFLRSEIVSG